MDRLNDLRRFYEILTKLEQKLGGKRLLATCNGRMNWSQRGVYFFFEPGEMRTHSGEGLRVVRVGTHALKEGSQAKLWGRLKQHQGNINNGGGNHRGSVFRLHIGTALIRRDGWPQAIVDTWGKGSSTSPKDRNNEHTLEQAVSRYIRQMPFLWLALNDTPGPNSQRGIIELNAIALLSNFTMKDKPLDPPSPNWLGGWADREYIRFSGLWNVEHVTEPYDPKFPDLFKKLVLDDR